MWWLPWLPWLRLERLRRLRWLRRLLLVVGTLPRLLTSRSISPTDAIVLAGSSLTRPVLCYFRRRHDRVLTTK